MDPLEELEDENSEELLEENSSSEELPGDADDEEEEDDALLSFSSSHSNWLGKYGSTFAVPRRWCVCNKAPHRATTMMSSGAQKSMSRMIAAVSPRMIVIASLEKNVPLWKAAYMTKTR